MGYKLKRILIYPDGVTEKQVYPAGWRPGANTIAYYPLIEDVLDHSGNGNNGSQNPNSFTGGVANYSGNSTTLPYSIINRSIYTVNVWVNSNQTTTRFFMGQHTSSNYGFNLDYTKGVQIRYSTGNGNNAYSAKSLADYSGWKNIVAVSNGTTMYLYINGTLSATETFGGYNSNTLYLGYDHGYNGGAWNGKISELIVENIVRSQQDISDYYDATKGNYGL